MVAHRSDGALVEFAYVSQAEPGLPVAALSRLERRCWAHNTRAGLTGELRLENGTFTQVIEGRWPDVMALASRILTDMRHSDISIRAFGPIETRRFASWSAVGLSADARSEPAAEFSPTNVCHFQARRPVAHARLAAPAAAGQAQGLG